MDAFESLYNETYAWIRGIVYRYLQNENDVDDVVQNIYIKIFTQLPQLKEPKTFLKWAKQIAVHESLNELKKKQAFKNSLVDYMPPTSETYDKEDISKNIDAMDKIQVEEYLSEFNPEAHIDEKETKRLLDIILLGLSDIQRTCILLWKDEYTTKEMADFLKIPAGTVKTHVYQAKKRIKEKVLELEKNGTKLYGMAPLPFFLWLFLQAEQGAASIAIDVETREKTLNKIKEKITDAVKTNQATETVKLETKTGIVKNSARTIKRFIIAASTIVAAAVVIGVVYYASGINEPSKPTEKSAVMIEATNKADDSKEKMSEKKEETKSTDDKKIDEDKKVSEKTSDDKKPEKPSKPAKPNKPVEPSNPTTPSKPAEPQAHTHNWVQQYTTVNHEATGHTEQTWVVDTPARDEPIYESHDFCNKCGADITGNAVVHSAECRSSYHAERVQVGTQHHDEVGHYESKWVEDSPAWTETIPNGYKCSGCGATK